MRTKSPELMQAIIEQIDKNYAASGRVPSMQEIADTLNITKGSVSNYVAEMIKRDMIVNNGGSRGLQTKNMAKHNEDTVKLPIVGYVACGSPLFAEQNIESYLTVSKNFLDSGEHFVLRAVGDSMINAGINDGELVIVRKQETADEGQIVLALIDNEATLKRYFVDKAKKQIRLHPENDSMEDMFYDAVKIQGVAVKVVKDLI